LFVSILRFPAPANRTSHRHASFHRQPPGRTFAREAASPDPKTRPAGRQHASEPRHFFLIADMEKKNNLEYMDFALECLENKFSEDAFWYCEIDFVGVAQKK